jgi:hypothetical protein
MKNLWTISINISYFFIKSSDESFCGWHKHRDMVDMSRNTNILFCQPTSGYLVVSYRGDLIKFLPHWSTFQEVNCHYHHQVTVVCLLSFVMKSNRQCWTDKLYSNYIMNISFFFTINTHGRSNYGFNICIWHQPFHCRRYMGISTYIYSTWIADGYNVIEKHVDKMVWSLIL